MADNITLNSGSGGSTLKTDENASSEHYQIVKLADGTADSDTIIAAGNGTNGNSLRVTLASDSSGQVALAAGSATVGTVNLGTFPSAATTSPAKLEDAASANGDMGVACMARRTATPADTSGADGDYEMLQMDNGRAWVQGGGSQAHDAAWASTNFPSICGGYAVETDGTAPGTAVTEGDVSYCKTDRDGNLLVNITHPYFWSASVDYGAAAQTNATVKAAPGASLSLYITDLTISNGPTAVNNVTLLDGSGGTVMYEVYMAQNANISISLRSPIKLTANTLLAVTSTGATELAINVSGYVAA